MITNKGSFTIDASINEIDTMDGFLNQLKRIASLFDNATTI
jgi:ribose 5-phosphate isomerase